MLTNQGRIKMAKSPWAQVLVVGLKTHWGKLISDLVSEAPAAVSGESCPVHSEQSIWTGWFLDWYYTAQATIMDQGWVFVPSIMRGSIYTVDKNSMSMLAHFSPQHLVQPLVHWLAAYSIVLWLWESCVLTAASYSLWWGTNVVLRLRSDSSQVRHLTAVSYTCVLHWLWVFYRNTSSSSIFCVYGWHKKDSPSSFSFFFTL